MVFFVKYKTLVLSNIFKSDDGHAGCPKAPRDFPPRKDGILYPRTGCLGTHLPLPQSLCRRTDGRSRDYYVRTKISRIDRLPGGVMNLSIAPIGIVRRMIRAMVTSQAGQVSKLKWLSNNHIARSLSRVIIQRI